MAALAVGATALLMIPLRGGTDDGPKPSAGLLDGSANATLTATARGVETTGTIAGITSLSVDGGSSISISGHLPGEDTVLRNFSVDERAFTLKGRDIALDASTIVKPSEVRFAVDSSDISNLTASGRVTLVASEITSYLNGEPTTHRASVSFVAKGEGNVRFGRRLGTDRPTTVRWTDAPATLRVRDSDRSMTSWAGTGAVRADGRRYTHEFGALAARGLQATFERAGGKVQVSGRGTVQQVYLDGEPQFRTTASCDLVQISEETAAGRRIELTWAPRNTGEFDMLMTRIVPIGPAAGWLSFGLEGAPNEFGGEVRPYRSGVTQGFHDGAPIRALLPPRDADRRDIGVSVPQGTANGTYDATVRIEGNFAPVVVPFEVIVVSAAAGS